ncbi:MAG: riboflavin kinase / adenylyltransferase [Tenuifilum sp.]|jgi:riboflavin kinase/FMN adenylyltransferase|uniref:bifunctional riboflavin kinase/FMN adenylyltransferase n=1 Tax=Tenuifilum sp. TaxID=2760880 RepID=UPI0024AA1D74|nr:riboflavin kinase [Tenuifilum sp.]MDI3526526.1 riboflavin kinase / adenylyltransferase [Tenuifilum sp.]
MKVHYGFDDLGDICNPVVTTGSFDGVHLGHKAIINRINEIARSIGGESVLITFYPHPRKVLYPETAGKNLMFILSQREKIELLSKTGLDHLIIVKFTLEFSKISSNQFIRDFLLSKLKAKYIVVGFNHHFGHNREGDYEELKKLSVEYNFSVEEIPEQDIHQETVSSTTIRKALLEGKIQRANAYLDHYYIIIGALGKGSHLFEQIGFPTLTVQIEEAGKLIPPEGVYATSLSWNSATYRAMVIIWSDDNEPHQNPIYRRNVEIHILDFDGKLHSNDAYIYFHKQVTEGLDTSNTRTLYQQLTSAAKQVDELIY